jgi:restriction endonuclease S subunit
VTVPEGWVEVSLGALLEAGGIFDGPFGSNLKTSDYTESGVRVLRLENLANLRFVEEKRTFISWPKYETLIRHTIVAGDILFGSFVDDEVRVCLVPALQTPAVAKADCFCIRPIPDGVDRRFLVYQLGTRATRDALLEEIHGVTRPRITTKQLRAFRVALAPLVEQRRIAELVDVALAQVNATRRRLARVPRVLTRFRQSVIAAGCSGRLTEEWRNTASFEPLSDTLRRVRFKQSRSGRAATDAAVSGRCILSVGDPGTPCPASWRWIPLTDVARLESGHTPSRKHPEYWNGHVPWVGL